MCFVGSLHLIVQYNYFMQNGAKLLLAVLRETALEIVNSLSYREFSSDFHGFLIFI